MGTSGSWEYFLRSVVEDYFLKRFIDESDRVLSRAVAKVRGSLLALNIRIASPKIRPLKVWGG